MDDDDDEGIGDGSAGGEEVAREVVCVCGFGGEIWTLYAWFLA